MKKILVFDIDDTLNNFTALYQECAFKYDKTLRGRGIVDNSKYVSKAFDWSDSEITEFKKKYRKYVHYNATIKEGAIEVLNKLKSKYTIWLLSAREESNYDLLYDLTKEQLDRDHVPYDKLIIESDKATFLKNQKDVLMFVDDSTLQCEKVIGENPNIKVYLFTNENNKNKTTSVPRVKDWYDVLDKANVL